MPTVQLWVNEARPVGRLLAVSIAMSVSRPTAGHSAAPRSRAMTRRRLMTITVGPIAVILLVVFGINLITSTDRSISQTERTMTSEVRTLSERFDGELRRVAQVAELTAKTVATRRDLTEEEIYRLLSNGVLQDPLIYGAAMAFVPGGFDQREAFSPYVYRAGLSSNELNRLDIAGAYDYLHDPESRWWRDPVTSGRSLWIEPYFDEGAGNIMMSTYSVPFFADGRLRGVTTIDIPLEPLQAFVGTELDVVVLTPEGRYVHRTDGIFEGNPTIFEQAADRPDLLEVARRMIAGEAGTGHILSPEGERQLVFFAPLPSAGWSFAVLSSRAAGSGRCPSRRVLAGRGHAARADPDRVGDVVCRRFRVAHPDRNARRGSTFPWPAGIRARRDGDRRQGRHHRHGQRSGGKNLRPYR